MSPREQSTAVRLLQRWRELARTGRLSRDADIIKLAAETDAFCYPAPVPRPFEPPEVKPVGNLHDVMARVCSPKNDK